MVRLLRASLVRLLVDREAISMREAILAGRTRPHTGERGRMRDDRRAP
jgi:hypothetical protein